VLYNLDSRLQSGEYGEALAEISLNEEIFVVEQALKELGHEYRTIAIPDSVDIVAIANLIRGLRPDVVFNLVEGVYQNSSLEMCIPALLELMKIPYTGNGPLTLGLCQDKARSKSLMRDAGIKTPWFKVASPGELCWTKDMFPAICKPLHEDGSLGITANSVVRTYASLTMEIARINIDYHQPAIVEEFIDGREFGIGIIGSNGTALPLPCSEIVFDGYPPGVPRIVSYNSKWNPDTIEYRESKPHCPADIPEGLALRLQFMGTLVYKLFGCKGYARVDMRVRDNEVYVLECNPNCDIAPGSGAETVLKAAGISYAEFVNNIINGAIDAHK
jgi:D-alanine-D-alanine ligase